MIAYICAACGVQFAETPSPPERCPVCEDSRAFGSERGNHQRWTTLAELRTGHRNRLRELEPDVVSIGTEPWFSVGQHCLLARGASGNILWDCISLIDDATVAAVRALGGISMIAISHPHFYTSMVEWSRAFGSVPIYLHAADRQWVLRPDSAIVPWDGDTLQLNDEFTLVRCGGHFDGATVLHWAARADRPGRLLSGDTIHVVEDGETVTFMHNFPKRIPLPAAAIRRLVDAIEPFEFERIYGCWPANVLPAGGKHAVLRSAERYIEDLAL